MEHPSSPNCSTIPDTLGTSTGDSVSTFPNTIHADTPRPSVNDNTSTSVISVDDTTQQNDFIATHLLSIGDATASLLSSNLSPQQKTVVIASLSAILSAAEGESKDKPVDLATSPPSSVQDKSSFLLPQGTRVQKGLRLRPFFFFSRK